MKDGIIPLTEYLGESSWSERMIGMLDDLKNIITVARNLNGDRYRNPVEDEINGELLQILSRVFWMTGEDNYLDWAMERGKGAMLLGGHFGNWELMGPTFWQLGYPVSLLAGDQSNKFIDAMMNRHQISTGCKIIHRGMGVRSVIKTFQNNEFVLLLSDQEAG